MQKGLRNSLYAKTSVWITEFLGSKEPFEPNVFSNEPELDEFPGKVGKRWCL